MTLREFLQTDEAKKDQLKTDFATCRADDRVHYCLRLMDAGGRDWLGVVDDTYLTAGVRREDLHRALEAKAPGERFEVGNSSVEAFSYPLLVVGRLDDDAAQVARRLVESQQPDLVVLDESDKPVAVLPAAVLAEHPALHDFAQRSG